MESLTKERIIETALELIRNDKDFKNINLREIARTLGCAHTNIYNYFNSATDLLWAAHTALQEVFMSILRDKINGFESPEIRLRNFFETVLEIYLDNYGWFRLAWTVYIGEERPQSDIDVNKKVRAELDGLLIEIWEKLYAIKAEPKKVYYAVHNVHCYIIGEVSNFISGRMIIEKKTEFKNYVVYNAIRFLTLSLKEE